MLSTDSADTEQLGEKLGKLLRPPALIELRSDLGGGKTTFVKGLARGLGFRGNVTSPTFTLNKIYSAKSGIRIAHHDFYRLKNPGIMADELSESLKDNKTITVVEWADIVKDVLQPDRLQIELKPTAGSPNERRIIINYPESQSMIIKSLENKLESSRP